MDQWSELERKHTLGNQASQPNVSDPWGELEKQYSVAPVAVQQEAPRKVEAPKKPTKTPSVLDAIYLPNFGLSLGNARDMLGGGVLGAGDIGATLTTAADTLQNLYPANLALRISQKGVKEGLKSAVTDPMQKDAARREDMTGALEDMGVDTSSLPFRGARLGVNVAGTSGTGGLFANGARAVLPTALATRAAPVLSAIESGGMTTGLAPSTVLGSAGNMGLRVLGGGINGALQAGLIDPREAWKGGVTGAALPPLLATTYGIGRGVVGGGKAIIQPFTESGQNAIRDKILRNAVGDTPVNLNTSEIVQGSSPTLAEATGNADIASLQRVARDMRPQAFVQREQANAAARNALFENAAGDAGKLEFFKQSRDQAANKLYSDAMRSGIDQKAAATPEVQAAIADLMKRPAMMSATAEAQRLAKNEGIELTSSGSLQGLHYTKMALDNQIGQAIRSGSNTDARILLGVKDKLSNVLGQLSPKYAEANATFAEMSKPVNQMEFLQGLRLTDAQGNMTLAKVQNAIRNIEQKSGESGINGAKSLTDEQLGALKSIRDDLLRQSNVNLGRSAGSNTFQNIATNNILSSMMPGKVGQILNNRIGTPLAQLGQIVYNKPNQAIQEKLIESMLNPQLANSAFNPLPQRINSQQFKTLLNNVYKSAPAGLLSLD